MRRAGVPVLHADLYRLRSEREVDELGLFDRADAIVLVEWPEARSGTGRGARRWRVTLSIPPDGNGRAAEITR